jgi:2,4-didehydro-3-deoxy-L-rhamnonate hydrolase
MRLVRVGPAGAERPGVLHRAGAVLDVSGLTADIGADFLADGGIDRVRAALDAGGLPAFDGSSRIGAPVARPGKVVCIGLNYSDHAEETGAATPAEPVVFMKDPATVIGPDDEVLIPRGSVKTDWEVELAVVIGRQARYLESPEQALAHVGGYMVSNDVSERAYQIEQSGGQWSKGKCCETFNPLGPVLATPDEVPDPQALGLRSWVNGEPRQDSNTSDMIFSVAYLVWHLSQFLVLDPGDVINTGTPQGVALSGRFPYLAAGDRVEMEIDGLGRQRQSCVEAKV